MPVSEQQIESMVSQVDQFGTDEEALKGFLVTIMPFVREYADEGKFKSLVRSMWMSGNKRAVKRVIHAAFTGPTKVEAQAQVRKDLEKATQTAKDEQAFSVLCYLATLGFCKGDNLTVIRDDGTTRTLRLPDELPAVGEDIDTWAEKSVPESVREKQLEIAQAIADLAS